MEGDDQADAGPVLPPGIESLEQLERLPLAMQAFLKKQYGIIDDAKDVAASKKDESSGTDEVKPKKQKIKYFPKPPAGPPPPEALASTASTVAKK